VAADDMMPSKCVVVIGVCFELLLSAGLATVQICLHHSHEDVPHHWCGRSDQAGEFQVVIIG